jgi:hypothetical protein
MSNSPAKERKRQKNVYKWNFLNRKRTFKLYDEIETLFKKNIRT